METFSALLAICAGNSPVPGEFPAQRPVTRSFDVYFDLRLNKRLSKQSWGSDLRRYRAHYDVIAMTPVPAKNPTKPQKLNKVRTAMKTDILSSLVAPFAVKLASS